MNASTKDRNAILKFETMLLTTYAVQLPGAVPNIPQMCMDSVACGILKHFHPIILSSVYPAKTVGDGNCLYRAISRSLLGTESHHLLYRLFTAIEMLSNPVFYNVEHKRFVDLIQDNRIFVSQYHDLLKSVTTPGAFSEMMHIYALSACIGQPIRSYFPPQLTMEFLSEPFSRKVVGEGVNKSGQAISTIMWSQMLPFNETFNPNHFVPLMSRNLSDTGEIPTIEVQDVDESRESDCIANESSDNVFESCEPESIDDSTNVSNTEGTDHVFSYGTLNGNFLPVEVLVTILENPDKSKALDNVPPGVNENVFL